MIERDDGARISFDTMGFFILPDKGSPTQWVTSAAVSFDTGDERYQWLNASLGVWEGEFDMGTYPHRYRVYVRTSE